jgi:diguanylate cyclase (GGDEF)-like protein
VLLILMIRKLQRSHTFSGFSAIVTVLESLGILLFFSVLQFYDSPNFMIQAMGMGLTILIIFVVPNRWENMLVLAIVSSSAYFLVAYFYMGQVIARELIASVFFVTLTIVLCAVKSIGTDRYARRAFLEKSRLELASARDFLTNAATRERLEEEARRWMNFCRRQGLPLCLVFADVDDLKRINDRFGHAMGDKALREVAAIMRSQLRNSDTIARWGGDEFVLLLLPNVTLQNAVFLLDRVKNAVEQLKLEGGVSVSCSFGVVQMGANSDYIQMLSAADAMMYQSKQSGKGKVFFSGCADAEEQNTNE